MGFPSSSTLVTHLWPERILFGTDWPIVPMKSYGDFIHRAVPEKHWSMVFEMNAGELFGLS